MSSNDWKKVKLKDCARFQEGYVNPSQSISEYFGNEIKWLRANDLNNSFVYDTSRKLSRKGFESAGKSALLFKPNTLAISKSGTIGRLGILKDYMCGNRAVINIEIEKDVSDTMFIFYSLLFSKGLIEQLGTGSVQKNLYISVLGDLDIDLPPLPTQRRIADILSALDEKIELNRQTNATLEALAQSIFREWFVELDPKGLLRNQAPSQAMESGTTGRKSAGQTFRVSDLPQGWRVGKLGEVCRNIRNTVHPKDVDVATAYVGLEHIPRKSLDLISWGTSGDVGSQKTRFKKYDILFGKLRPYFHKVCIAPVDGICSTDILVIEPLNSNFFSFCLNYLFSTELITFVSAVADGTRMPRVDWNSISNYEIVIPPENLLAQFNDIIFPLYEKIIENNQQSATLASAREALLPKLMSGEVEV